MPDENKLNELISDLPPEIQLMVAEHLPVLAKMALDEIREWIDLAINGRTEDAYRVLLVKMNNADLLNEMDALNVATDEANADNAASIAKQRAIASNVCMGLLTVAVGYMARYVPIVLPDII